MREGIDVCQSAGKIDFKKIKDQGLFVIIRAGYGGNYTSQDDKKYLEYVNGCKKYDIPWGLYLYSYATNEDKKKSELAHIQRIVKNTGKPPLGFWLDIEDTKSYNKAFGSVYSAAAKKFINAYAKYFYGWAMGYLGIRAGIYANADYWKNVFDNKDPMVTKGLAKWVAAWGRKTPPTNEHCIFWQYKGSESKPKIDGVSGSVDLNREVKCEWM